MGKPQNVKNVHVLQLAELLSDRHVGEQMWMSDVFLFATCIMSSGSEMYKQVTIYTHILNIIDDNKFFYLTVCTVMTMYFA